MPIRVQPDTLALMVIELTCRSKFEAYCLDDIVDGVCVIHPGVLLLLFVSEYVFDTKTVSPEAELVVDIDVLNFAVDELPLGVLPITGDGQ